MNNQLNRLSRLIPLTFIVICLLPLLLISWLWSYNLLNISDLQQQQVEQRFYQTHQRMVEHEVNSIVDRIDGIRSHSRLRFEERLLEHLSIAYEVLEQVYHNNSALHKIPTLREHALDAIEPVLSAGQFQSSWIFTRDGQVLFRDELLERESLFVADPACVEDSLEKSGDSIKCIMMSEKNKPFVFFVRYFKPFDIIVAVGTAEDQILQAAKDLVIQEIAKVRYGENGEGYLFAFHYDGVYLSHPVEKYIGQNMIDISDPNGVQINREIVKVSQLGSGYVHYVWDRYKTGQLVEKVSYVKGYNDWQWAIGTGFYLDTLFQTQEQQEDLVFNAMQQAMFVVAVISILLVAVIIWIALRISNHFNTELSHFSQFFAANATEATPIEIDKLRYDEFKTLASSANHMLEARQAAQQQVITTFNHIDDIIYVADPATNELLFVNQAVETLYGDNLVGKPCTGILKGLDLPVTSEDDSLWSGEHSDKVNTSEFEDKLNQRWYGIVERAIKWYDGRLVRLVQARDITDIKLAEIERASYQQRLQQAVDQRTDELQTRTQQLEQANRDLEGFSYSVSHDLRSPLRAIDGFIAILKQDYQDKLDDEGLRLFSIVQDNARKMGELIDDILAFSRAGRLALDKQLIDMQQLVHSVWHELGQQYPIDHIDFRCDRLPSANADPSAIHQVFSNLLSNAIKFSAPKQLPIIQVSGAVHDNKVHYIVTDNGVGFNNEFKNKLFVMFQRLHGMDEFEGTGVGLAIVKRFVDKHGGQVDADGSPNKGARFSFELPLTE
jgi:signal transduction histidine kinase